MKEECIDVPFVYRPYEKTELARLYIPYNTKRVAMRKFNNWLRFSPVLWKQLESTNFNIRHCSLTYDQVKIIVDYLGEP